MRRPHFANSALGVASPNEMPALDEEFLRLVDRVLLQRKQADPFRLEEAWRATEDEARLRHLLVRDERLDRNKGR